MTRIVIIELLIDAIESLSQHNAVDVWDNSIDLAYMLICLVADQLDL